MQFPFCSSAGRVLACHLGVAGHGSVSPALRAGSQGHSELAIVFCQSIAPAPGAGWTPAKRPLAPSLQPSRRRFLRQARPATIWAV